MNRVKDVLQNNRGASLVIIVAIFALCMVLAMNVLMAAHATTTGLNDEYDTERINMYVSSVYNCINQKVIDGSLNELFEAGADKTATFTGFDGGNVTVTGHREVGTKEATATFTIPFEGSNYKIQTVYTLTSTFPLVKSCTGLCADL